MGRISIKQIITLMWILKIVFIIFTFVYQGELVFCASLTILIIIIVIEMGAVILIKYKKRYLISTIVLCFCILPIMSVGLRFGPTFGNEIRFNNILWKQSINQSIRYFMANDIIRRIDENNYSKSDILEILGEPDLGGHGYSLRGGSLFGAFDLYILLLEFDDDRVVGAKIMNIE